MSQRELDKYEVIQRAIRHEITVPKAGELLGLSDRQIYNLKVKVKKSGAPGPIDANRGEPSNRRMPDRERQEIIQLLGRYYSDFKPTHAIDRKARLGQLPPLRNRPESLINLLRTTLGENPSLSETLKFLFP